MSLADFKIFTETVSFKGGSVTVRGLALDDITVLLHNKLADLDDLMALYGDHVDDRVAITATAQYAIGLVRRSPDLVATIISLAADEPELEAKARRLPMPTQVKLIERIVELTFVEAGGVKKFIESLMNLLTKVRPANVQTGSNT